MLKRFLKYWSSDKRFRNLLLALFYAMAYDYVYLHFVNYHFGYALDGDYVGLLGLNYFSYLLIAAFPFIFFKGVKSIASTFSLIIYVMSYIPIINALMVYRFTESERIQYIFIYCIMMILFFLTDGFFLFKNLFTAKRKLISFKVIEIIAAVCIFFILVINVSQMHFSNFLGEAAKEMYELRADNEIRGIYIFCWVRGAFLPLMTVYYLKTRQYKKYVLAFMAFILLFMIDKQKVTAVFPLLITALYYIVSNYGKYFTLYFHTFLILFLGGISLSMVYYIDFYEISFSSNPLPFTIASLLIMRTQCICGEELVNYFLFFVEQGNPFTNYGHVGIINSLTGVYPYTESVGQVVAGGEANSNATFWLMDGMAAAGILGVVIISIIFIIFKSMMNSLEFRCNMSICICIMLYGINYMLNVSLFTSINSSGLFILFLIILLSDMKEFNVEKVYLRYRREIK